MLSEQAVERMGQTQSTSFSCDLAKWHSIMGAYLNGGHAYHATMPTDALRAFRDVVMETKAFGYSEAKMAQQVLGSRVRSLLTERGFKSVAAEGFGAPGVTVSYTSDPNIKNGSAFAAQGLQVAAGVPLQVDEPEGFSTFRLGLFGLDKLKNLDRTVETLGTALDAITAV
jgi:aspartate aminotransferase-like enzyme